MKQQRNLTLPNDVLAHLDILGQDDRNVYMQALRARGWTLQSIASGVALSRERVRQIVAREWPEGWLDESAPVPEPPAKRERVPHPRVQVEPSEPTLRRLRELAPVARTVVGSSSRGRAEAEEYARLLWYAHTVEGVTFYHLAQLVGVSTSAVRLRLQRYGYIPSSGARASKPILTSNRVV